MTDNSVQDVIKKARVTGAKLRKSIYPSGSGAQSAEEGIARLGELITEDRKHEKQGTPTNRVGAEKAFSGTGQRAHDVAEQISFNASIANGLHSSDSAKIESALERFKQMHPSEVHADPAKQLDAAKETLRRKLTTLTKEGEELHKKHHEAWKGSAATAEETPKKLSFSEKISERFSRGFERHEKWLAGKTDGAKLGITAAESALGFVGTIMGLNMIYSASTQHLKHRVQRYEDGQSDVVMTPISGSERLLKLAAGVGVTAAGVTGIAMAARGSGGHSHG